MVPLPTRIPEQCHKKINTHLIWWQGNSNVRQRLWEGSGRFYLHIYIQFQGPTRWLNQRPLFHLPKGKKFRYISNKEVGFTDILKDKTDILGLHARVVWWSREYNRLTHAGPRHRVCKSRLQYISILLSAIDRMRQDDNPHPSQQRSSDSCWQLRNSLAWSWGAELVG